MISRTRVLPLDADDSGRYLPWAVAVMTYLAVLALAGGMAIGSVVARWDGGLANNLTVQIPALDEAGIDEAASAKGLPSGGMSSGAAPPKARKSEKSDKSDSAAGKAGKGAGEDGVADPESRQQARVEKALAVLRATPGVIAAESLDKGEIAALLKPWLGAGTAAEDLPLPHVIDVAVDPAASIDTKDLARRLEAEVPGALVDDPAEWLARVASLLHSAELVAFLVVVLTVSAAALTIVFVTRTGLAVHNPIIEVLHLIGAEDIFIARQFQTHALKLGLIGALPGLALAAGTLLFLGAAASRIDAPLLPKLSLSLLQWIVLAAVPVVVALIAVATARVTVMRRLARMI
ncbi:MAG: cell division protein [Alphaproteobacteria bacterium]